MDILIGCEFAGTVRDAFSLRGFNAYRCDILQSEKTHGNHLQMDIMEAIKSKAWDFIGLHLPCTKVALCGNGTCRSMEKLFT